LGAQAGSDVNSYKVVHKTTTEFGPAGRYLVNDQGAPVYLADPGINGVYTTVPGSGQTVTKFSAPKATLMSYIIKGVLGGDLPWALILLGTMIAITLELAGTSSLAFAVGMYLPISTSTPILLGGVVRWGVDRYLRAKPENQGLSEDEMTARTDQSQGVLLASRYIAGATLAGVVYSFLNLSESVTRRLVGFERWATEHDRAFDGPTRTSLASFQSSSSPSFCISSGATGSCESAHLHSDGLARLPQPYSADLELTALLPISSGKSGRRGSATKLHDRRHEEPPGRSPLARQSRQDCAGGHRDHGFSPGNRTGSGDRQAA